KACEGNEAKDPELGGGFDEVWMRKFINRSAAERGKVTMDDWNKWRQLLGLPLEGSGGKGPSGFCMWYDWQKALKLVPKSIPQGAPPKKPKVKSPAPSAAASYTYEPAEFAKVFADLKAFDGKRVEIVAYFAGEKSQYYFPGTGIGEKEYMGVQIVD